MLSDNQIELAARKVCEQRGLDPDKVVSHGADPDPETGFIPAIALHSPIWELVAREVKDHERIAEAVDEARRMAV